MKCLVYEMIFKKKEIFIRISGITIGNRFILNLIKLWLVLSVTDPAERLKHFIQRDHCKIYGADFLKRVTEAGFEVRSGNFMDYLPLEEKRTYCLPDKEFMYRYFKL